MFGPDWTSTTRWAPNPHPPPLLARWCPITPLVHEPEIDGRRRNTYDFLLTTRRNWQESACESSTTSSTALMTSGNLSEALLSTTKSIAAEAIVDKQKARAKRRKSYLERWSGNASTLFESDLVRWHPTGEDGNSCSGSNPPWILTHSLSLGLQRQAVVRAYPYVGEISGTCGAFINARNNVVLPAPSRPSRTTRASS